MDDLILSLNLLRKRPGKSNRPIYTQEEGKREVIISHMKFTLAVQGVVVFVCTRSNISCIEVTKAVPVVVVTILLQICWFSCSMLL